MRKHVLILATILWIAFIFFNSMQTGTDSGQMSGILVGWVDDILQAINIQVDVAILSIWIRKLAHLFEYFVLGVLMYYVVTQYNIDFKRTIIYSFSIALLVSIIDEVIQTFVAGRAGLLTDVLIDALGVIIGISIVLFFKLLQKQKL